MHIISRILGRWLRRTRPAPLPIIPDRLPGLTDRQYAAIRWQDECRRNGRPR